MDVDLEEIQCPLCKEQFTEKTKVPLLLPDCGHSYCIQCIEEHSIEVGFEAARRRTVLNENFDEDEDLTKGDSPFAKAVDGSNNNLLDDINALEQSSQCKFSTQRNERSLS